MTYRAVLVEDNVPNGNQYAESLRANNFSVEWFTNASDARAYLVEHSDFLIDLFVLDREIPEFAGGNETTDTGDVLFEEIQASWLDTAIFVFTAHSTPEHTQHAISNRGRLSLGPSVTVDRVQIMYKEQGLRFLELVRQVALELDSLQDIHVIQDEPPAPSDRSRGLRRLFSKLAARNGCGAIRIRPLGGGRSGDEVFECELLDDEGIAIAAFVGKTRKPGWVAANGGMFGLPQDIVAPHVDVVSGMASGTVLELFQIVTGATPLDELLKSNAPDAGAAVDALATAVVAHVATSSRRVELKSLLEPLITLDFLAEQMESMGLDVPRSTLSILSKRSVQHGDLHGGNVLVKDRHPALIDFGKSATASQLLDPITLMLSMWLHPDGRWFTDTAPEYGPVDAIKAAAAGRPEDIRDEGLRATVRWLSTLSPDSRELWLLSLGYAIRQLWYETASNPVARSHIVAIASEASAAIAPE